MSSEWPLVEISTICEGIFDGPHATPQKTEQGPIFLGISSLNKGRLDLSKLEYLSEDDFKKWTRRITPKAGDLVFSYETRLGEVAMIPEGLRCCLGRRMALMRINQEKAIPEYVLYAYLSPLFQDVIRARTIHGSTVDRIPLMEFGTFPIHVPPLDVQSSIASILKALDDRIALLRETNATLEAIAQALFKSWFVDFDPVHANASTQAPSLPPEIQALFPATFTDSPQGPIPDEWRWGTIADLAVLNPESWTAKKHPNTVAYIDLANAKDNMIADIAEFEFDAAPSRARRVLRDGDTIVGTVRPGNRSFAFIHGAANNLTGSTGFAVLRPKHEKNTAFTYLAATNDSSIDYLTHIADGGAYPAVKPEVVANLACIVPPVEVLEAFNSVTAELLRKITKNQQQAQVIANLRDTLLPRLISGQLRLPEAEQAIAAITD